LQALDLYAQVEQYLGFEDEIHELYKTFGHLVLSKEPKTLIDIGCGQGEFCYVMGYNGVKAFGVDLSKKQIEIAKQKDVDVQCVDIKDIKTKYDCATAVFDVINYIPKQDLKAFLTHSYNLLNTNGYFIFDINSLFGFEEIATGTLNIELDDRFIAIDANYDEEILKTDITLFTQETELYKKEQGSIEQYYHTKENLSKLLVEIGFIVEEIVDFSLHSQENADKHIFVCKRV
jgi:SAM-dependent methyltransferase